MNRVSEMNLVDIDKLIPYVNNARTHSKEQINKLRASIREFGFINPVIIDRDYNVIAGHGRIMASKEEGIDKVPCVFVDYLTDAQKKAYILADNRMALDADWDEELLKVEIESLQGADFDLSLTGFDETELAGFFDTADDAKEDDFDVEEELKNPTITKNGDLWLLGNHRLLCGDSTREEAYTILMNDKKANLVVTDPPYNVNYEGSAGKIKNDNLESDKFYQFLFDAFSCMKNAMADDASIYVFHADTEGLNFLTQAFIFQVLVFGKSRVLFSEEVRISGSMNPVCLVGRKTESTGGIQTENRPQYGSLISRRKTVTIRQ